MKLQVLISTMHQKDHALLEKMNIHSDAIVINQCDHYDVENFSYEGHEILWMSFAERGIGLSRNNALMRATGDILLFADDDVIYSDDYVERVLKTFEENPDYDMIVFNLRSMNPDRPIPIVKKSYRLHWFNCLKFGGCKIAIRKESIRKANVYYSLLFGGGAPYQSGEDTFFIVQCLRQGIKGFASEKMIGSVRQDGSSWFNGYDEKYFFDTGVLMKQCFGLHAKILIVPLVVKNRSFLQNLSLKQALHYAMLGVKSF